MGDVVGASPGNTLVDHEVVLVDHLEAFGCGRELGRIEIVGARVQAQIPGAAREFQRRVAD